MMRKIRSCVTHVVSASMRNLNTASLEDQHAQWIRLSLMMIVQKLITR